MKYTPHSYQDDITNRIVSHHRLAIWAGMGMGKTAATLTAITLLPNPGPVLVLAPKLPASSTWPEEIRKWDHLKHLRVSIIVGTAMQRQAALRANADIYCMNYDNLPWLLEQLKKWPFKIVIADESTRLKSFRHRGGGKRAYALARMVAHKHIDRFINLSGTPAPNGIVDLWGQTWFLDQGKRLGSTFTAFRNRWFTPFNNDAGFIQWEPTPQALGEVTERVKDICFSYQAEDYFGIDKPLSIPLTFDLPPRARAIYDRMEEDFFAEIEGQNFEAANAGAKSVKCLQIAGGALYLDEDEGHNRPWQTIHDMKIEILRSVIEEAAGEPILVAYQFIHEAERILKAFPLARMLTNRAIPEWNAGKIPIMVAHPASAGHGINLQDGGRILVFFGHWWNLEQHEQIIERIGPVRQKQAGHPRTVKVYYIIARNTLDEEVLARHQTKRSIQEILKAAAKRRIL